MGDPLDTQDKPEKMIKNNIRDRVRRTRDHIEAACARVGRSADGVTVVAVTKTHGADVVSAVIEAGITDIGENRVQEFLEKRRDVTAPCRWHLVGTLQSNKATKVIGQFDLIHSIDRLKIAQTLSRLGVEHDVTTPALLEVNTSREITKHGFEPEEVARHISEIASLPNLNIEGLMTIGPLTDDTAVIRRAFQSLFRLREKLAGGGRMELPHLSMGMTDDYEMAVEEGATLVRLGRVLVGERRRR